MAFRPSHYVIEGELDNTQLGVVTGWIRFAGIRGRVVLNLRGNFHRDIQGAKIHFIGDARGHSLDAQTHMQRVSQQQTGKVGNITAGLPPMDYTDYPYIEWYSEENGRVVIELDRDQVEVIGQPVPVERATPISAKEQAANLYEFLDIVSGSIAGRR